MVWRYGTWQPTSWDDALDLVARVTARVIDKDDEDDLFVSMFDHGGTAGGYENTWGTGKLYFGAMKVKHCRIHNRPAYNSEVHSHPRHGRGRAELLLRGLRGRPTRSCWSAPTRWRRQTNLFLNHMVPRGCRTGAEACIDRRSAPHRDGQRLRGRWPGADNVLHLAITSGTDLALFNTLFTYIADQGWVDADFIAASTFQGDVAVPEDAAHPAALGSFEAARAACKMTLADGAAITGLTEAQIIQGRRMDRQAQGRRQPPQDGAPATKRASSGATTTTAPSARW